MDNFPDYAELFGALDFKEGDEARSVYSPAAYLADLIQLMDDEFVDDELDGRRTDIRQILLDSENTYTLIPYLGIVNEVLEKKLASDIVNQIIKGENENELRKKLGASIYNGIAGKLQKENGQVTISSKNDMLEATNEALYKDLLIGANYPFNMPFNLAEEEVKLFLQYLGISAEELHKLFATSDTLSDKYVVREYLGVSPEEWDIITRENGITDEQMKAYFGYDSNISNTDFIKDLSQVSQFMESTGLSGQELRELIYQKLSDGEVQAELATAFYINIDEGGYAKLNESEDKIIRFGSGAASDSLLPIWFDRVNEVIHLSKKTKTSFTDLDTILRLSNKTLLNEESLKIIAFIKKFHETTELPIDEVVALIASINEQGHTEGEMPEDLFSRVFNNKYAEQDNQYIKPGNDIVPHQYIKEGYTEMVYADDLFSEANYYFRKRLVHALGISEMSLEKIIQRLDDKEVDKALWLDYGRKIKLLNFLYRFVKLSEVLDLSHEEVFTLFDLLEQDPSILEFNQHNTFLNQRPSTQDCLMILISGNVEDRLWLIQSMQSLKQWMMAYDLSADLLWYVAMGKFKSEKAETTAKNLTISQLNNLLKAFMEVKLKPSTLMQGDVDDRTAQILYDRLKHAHKGDCKYSAKLIETNNEHAKKIATEVVPSLAHITPMDFKGLGIEERLVEKISRNLVYKAYTTPSGILNIGSLPERPEDFQLETDFGFYLKEVFDIIHGLYIDAESKTPENDEVVFYVYTSDLRTIPLTEEELQEIYDNLIFNHYIDEEGMVKFSNFFSYADNWQHFDVNTHIQEHAYEVYHLLKNQLDKFHAKSVKLTASTFEELALTEVEINDLLENLAFNEYTDGNGQVKSKEKLLAEDAESLRLALQFYPHRHEIIKLIHDELESVREEYLMLNKEKLAKIADGIIAEWAYEDLQGNYLEGEDLLPEAKKFFTDEENKEKLVLGYYFEEATGTAIFMRMQQIIKSSGKYQLEDKSLTDMKFYQSEIDELITRLVGMGMLTWSRHIPVDKIDYFLNSDHAISFSIDGFEDFNKEIFFMLQKLAKATQTLHEAIIKAITTLAEKQDNLLWEHLQTIFSLNEGSIKIISDVLFEGQDKKMAWLLPIMKSANALGELTDLPNNKAYNKAFQRVRQFAVLANKLQMGEKETAIAFDEQDLAAKFPEALEMPKQVEVAMTLDQLTMSGSLIDGSTLAIEEISPNNLPNKALKGFLFGSFNPELIELENFGEVTIKAQNGELTIFEDGESEVKFNSSEALGALKTLRAQKGRIEGAEFVVGQGLSLALYEDIVISELHTSISKFDLLLETQDLIHLFAGGLYWTYRRSDYELVDRYGLEIDNPKADDQLEKEEKEIIDLLREDDNLRKAIKENPVRQLFEEKGMLQVDAAFYDKDGSLYILNGTDYHTRRKGEECWLTRTNPFGLVDNDFAEISKIDAAYVDADNRLYLFADHLYVRYSNASTADHIDKGYPKVISESWADENVEVNWPEIFTGKVDAAFEGKDGETYFFQGNRFVTSKDEKTQNVSDHWGKIKHDFRDTEGIDAAFTFDGFTYLFSGDQVLKYTDTLENEGIQIDENYPMSLADFLPELPAKLADGIDAIFDTGNGSIRIFKEEEYWEFDIETASTDSGLIIATSSDPKPVTDWGKLNNTLQTTGEVNAAIVGLDGYTYVFSGEMYYRYKTGNYNFADPGYPRSIAEDWEGLTQVDAAFVLNGKTYIFGERTQGGNTEYVYIRYSTRDYTQMDEVDEEENSYITPVGNLLDIDEIEVFPAPQIDLSWWSIPQAALDLGYTHTDAILNAHDGKSYLFFSAKAKGYFMEFEHNHRWWSEPMSISEKWDDLPFTTIDAAVAGKDGKTYFFSGNQYVRFSDKEACHIDNGYPRQVNKYWGEVKNNIIDLCMVDAIVTLESREYDEDKDGDDVREISNHVYLFSGDQFFRYKANDLSLVESGYPKQLSQLKHEPRFKNLSGKVGKVDAAFADFRNVYLFEGEACHVISDVKNTAYLAETKLGHQTDLSIDYPEVAFDRKALENTSSLLMEDGSVYGLQDRQWNKLTALEGVEINNSVSEKPKVIKDAPASWQNDVDAVLQGTDGNTYYFKGSKCFNHLLGTEYNIDVQWGRPKNTIDTADRIDAAFVGKDGNTYVFSGTQYYTYKTQTYLGHHLDDRPEEIAMHWTGLQEVAHAYVMDGKTYLFEKADAHGYFSIAIYHTDDYKLETPEMFRADDSYWGIPYAQQKAGFDQFDSVMCLEDNLIFIKDQHFIRYHTKERNWSNPKELNILFPDIHFNKTNFKKIKTVFKGADDKLYFFDECYFTVGTHHGDGSYSYADLEEVNHYWGLFNNPLHDGVDATLVHDGYTYLFAGNQYVRYSDSEYDVVDAGYPKIIAEDLLMEEPFACMGKEFKCALEKVNGNSQLTIDAVITNPRNTYVLIDGDLYVGSKKISDTFWLSRLSHSQNNFKDTGHIDAAFVKGEHTYLFSGEQYIRYTGNRYHYVDTGYPKFIEESLADEPWVNGTTPQELKYGIDAAFSDSTMVYLFKDEKYWLFDGANISENEIKNRWGLVDNSLSPGQSIDAAYTDESGRLFVFKGEQFIRYSDTSMLFSDDDKLPKYVDAGYPMLIDEHDAHLRKPFVADLDSTFWFENRLFFTKNGEYVLHKPNMKACEDRFYPQAFKYRWGNWSDYLLMDIYLLARFMKLNEQYTSSEETLSSLLYDKDGYTKESYWALSEIFGFDKEDIRWVLRNNTFLSETNGLEQDFRLEAIIRMYDILSITQRIKVDAKKLYEDVWMKLYDGARDYTATKVAADNLYQMLGSVDYNDNYQTLFDEIERALNTIKRDALVPYAVANDNEVEDVRDLYEKLLIDVQMENEASTSRIKEATMAIQLFFHRYFLNLEEVDLKGTIDEEKRAALKEQWEWMRNYRVWEANRKVFLYPENYIRPELRDEDMKTPAFETLEQDLMQGEITEEAVERVYKKYLDEFTEVSRLKIAGGYMYDEADDSNPIEPNRRLVLFGRTKTDPLRYYYRFGNFINGQSSNNSWGAWKPLNITIEAEKVYPVYAFNKVFVFWPKIETVPGQKSSAQIDNSGDIVNVSSDEKVLYTVKIYFSYYDLNENWIQPQELKTVFEKPVEKSVLEDYLKSVDDGNTTDELYKGVKISEFDLSGYTFKQDTLLSQLEIADVNLSVEYANKLDDSDHDNIVIACQYSTVRFKESLIKDDPNQLLIKNANKVTKSFVLTPELYTEVVANPVAFGNIGKETFSRLFDELGENDESGIENQNVVVLNTTSNSLDAPWFAYDHKGGSFLCKPDVPVLGNDEVNDGPELTAAFKWNNKKYYFTKNEKYTIDGGAEKDISSQWGLGTVPQANFARVDSAFNWNGGVYILDADKCLKLNSDLADASNKPIDNNLYEVLTNMSPQGLDISSSESEFKNLKILAAYEYLNAGQESNFNDKDFPDEVYFHVEDQGGARSTYAIVQSKTTANWSLKTPNDAEGLEFIKEGLTDNGADWTAGFTLSVGSNKTSNETINYQFGFKKVGGSTQMQVAIQRFTDTGATPADLHNFSGGSDAVTINREITGAAVEGVTKIYLFSGTDYIEIDISGFVETTSEIELPDRVAEEVNRWTVDVNSDNTNVKTLSLEQVANKSWVKREQSTTSNFETVDAAYIDGTKLCLISGTNYVTYSLTVGQDIGDKPTIDGGIVKSIDPKAGKVDAAFKLGNIMYLLEGDKFYALATDTEPDKLDTAKAIKGNWVNLPSGFASNIDAALTDGDDLTLYKKGKSITYNIGNTDNGKPRLYKTDDINYEIVRLTSSTAKYFTNLLFSGGIDALLQLSTQQVNEEPAFSTSEKDATTIKVKEDHVNISNLPVSNSIDYNSANGMYYWEVFFHVPFLIAQSLNTDQKFEEAKKWFEHIYDPTAARYFWKFMPFQAVDVDALIAPLDELLLKTSVVKPGEPEFIEVVDFLKAFNGEIKGMTDQTVVAQKLLELDELIKSDRFKALEAANHAELSAAVAAIKDLKTKYESNHKNVDITDELGLSSGQVKDIYDFGSKVSGLKSELKEFDDELLGLSEGNSLVLSSNFDDILSVAESLVDDQIDSQSPEQLLLEVLQLIQRLPENYEAMKTTVAQERKYLNDPFDPHAIAQLRPIAYRKTIVMSYIDNLLDWGDMLFRQYTRESINEARMLYVLAYDLLGKKPENLGTLPLPDETNYEGLYHNEDLVSGDDYDFLLELENANDQYTSLTFAAVQHDSIANPYFYIPENSLFGDYWNRVEDRLFKIRNSLNILGEKQPLPLFQPPIDPMALVNAVAAGGSVSEAITMLNTTVPHYRFNYMLEKAKAYADKLSQFGADLLGAIEKKDAEELELLNNKQEAMILALNTQIKEKQIKDAEENIKNLEESKKSAENQRDHYTDLIDTKLIGEEETQIGMMSGALGIHGLTALAHITSGLSYVIPQVTAGPFSFGVTSGGQQVGKMLDKFGDSSDALAETLSMGGEIAGIYAQYKRSEEDWELQKAMSISEIKQLEFQIASAKLQKKIAQKELDAHKQEIENNESVARFMQDKFSSMQLYNWMSSKLSGLFHQTFKMAHDIAKQAERAFVFETGSKVADIQFIGGTYWDSQRKGLMSGETLGHDLARMEKAYMEQDSRGMEITKNISLLKLDPMAYLQLKMKGQCVFRLTEELFDQDFPGHYNRQLKTISLAFDIGEGKTVNATLTQLNNKLVMEPDIKAVKYLLDAKGDQPMTIRTDWKVNQQIALSYVDEYTENNGLFELRYDDERYLPFEGTGAVSLWKLELQGKAGSYNLEDLLDVTIKLRYTAEQGGAAFANAVKGALKPYQATSFFDIAYTFPEEWNDFMLSDRKTMELNFTQSMFPAMVGSKATGLVVRYQYEDGGSATFELNDELNLGNNQYLESANLNVARNGSNWKFTVKGDKSQIANVEMVVVYKAKA